MPESRSPRRSSGSAFGRVVAPVGLLLWLAAPLLLAATDPRESRLDLPLKLLYRTQRARSAPVATWPAGPERPREAVDRLIGRRVQASEDAPLSLLVRYRGPRVALERAGFRVQAQLGSIHTGTLAPDRLLDLLDVPGVLFVQTSRQMRAFFNPEPALRLSALPLAPRPPPGPMLAAPTGVDVLVAFIDTGVDIRHLDFRKPDLSTRIKYLLDFSDPGDVDGDGLLDGTGPFGGTLYTESDINAALSGGGSFGEKDTTGHGTHGLSIAAGDEAPFPGMAPAADLLVVKATREDGSLGFTSEDIINALDFVNQKATELGEPYVVNLSLGTIAASHDGRSLEEQAIDETFASGKAGKVAVVAAGNSSANRVNPPKYHHFRGIAHVGLDTSHTLTIPAYTPRPGKGDDKVGLDIWYSGRDKLTITVTAPDGTTQVSAAYGNYADESTLQGNVFIANVGGASAENGDTEARIVIDNWSGTAPAVGNWTVTFRGEAIEDTGAYDGWLTDDSDLGGGPEVQPYLSANADNSFLVGKPGGAYNAITVGSYALHDVTRRYRTSWTDVNGIGRTDTTAVIGDISDFSSTGKTRDGRTKPELAAPGERVRGAASADAYPGVAPNSIYRFHSFAEPNALIVDDTADQRFGMLQGTSFSAPVVTGLVARILETSGTLDAIQVRNILINSATTDSFTGAVPNDLWGYGKVNEGVGEAPLPVNLRIATDSVPEGSSTGPTASSSPPPAARCRTPGP